jgi:transcriptional regulator with XRE-family HTH domain
VLFKEMRERRGLDVGSLARSAGVLPVMVEKIERDEMVPLHIAANVADALEMSQAERYAAYTALIHNSEDYKARLRTQRDEFNDYARSLGVEVDA